MNRFAQGTSVGAAAIVAAEIAAMFAGATLPTPLYPLYRNAFGLSAVTLTVIYAVYVLGNLIALVVFGRLADQIGRRNASLPAIGFGIASATAFTFASGTEWLLAARVLSGFATGLAAGAATAWIGELYGKGGGAIAARIASAATFVGLAMGALLAGLLARFAPHPLQLSYGVYFVFLIGIAVTIAFVPETVVGAKRSLGEVSLKLRLGVPKAIRRQFVSPAVTAFAIFALLGFYAALIPSLLVESLHLSSPAIAGGVVLELFLVAAATIVVTGALDSRAAMLWGLVLLPPSLWLLVAAQLRESMPVLLAAAAIGGVSGGLGYRGSFQVVSRLAPADQRSEVISSYFIAIYAGNSLPVIGIGLLSDFTSSLAAHVVFAALITALAGVALFFAFKYAPAPSDSAAP